MVRWRRFPGRKLRLVLILLGGLSLFQYLTLGEISWHRGALDSIGSTLREYATRPEAAWRRATGKLEQVGAAREGTPPSAFDLSGRVVRVADGDSLSLLDRDNKQHAIRLYGIDAPERDQPHGEAAGAALAALVENARIGVTVIEEDDYGRLVGTAYADGTNINLAMVRAGHAWWYRHYAPVNMLSPPQSRKPGKTDAGCGSVTRQCRPGTGGASSGCRTAAHAEP
ncbi:thermonuclease family protein [Kineobactrum salinum]|uniref:TNase-like domain-containing protein n=1 Tax=Kineobactrum salinum TaxID=2708301 RepID=A0A6C0U8P3_9GAMM|nr:thermonuclease family protein [Kineobactrum salinum]QIB65924.1 hypothetical protein G3T16_11335 [Kineobactrum salinum]